MLFSLFGLQKRPNAFLIRLWVYFIEDHFSAFCFVFASNKFTYFVQSNIFQFSWLWWMYVFLSGGESGPNHMIWFFFPFLMCFAHIRLNWTRNQPKHKLSSILQIPNVFSSFCVFLFFSWYIQTHHHCHTR